MDHGPLVMDEIEAGANLIRRVTPSIPLKAAFWLKTSEEDFRYLYLASDQVDEANFGQAVDQLLRIVRQRPSLFLDPFRVNLIGGDHRFAMAAAEINQQWPSKIGTRLGSQPFGGSFVIDGYIYPTQLAAGFPRSFA